MTQPDYAAIAREIDLLRKRVKELEAMRVPADPVDDTFQVLPGHAPVQPEDPRAIAVIKRLEAELQQLRERVKELEAENQRMWDLVRYQRAELHQAELLSDDEYTALLADWNSRQRLCTYDDVRAELQQLRAERDELRRAMENVKGDGHGCRNAS